MTKLQPANLRVEDLLEKKQEKSSTNPLKEIRTYEFYNIEEPGLSVKFVYGPTTNPKRYSFMHGQRVQTTVEVAEHVESRQTPIWKWRPDGKGSLIKELTGWKPRFQMREVRS